MRDFIVIGAILASLPFCFRKPFIGILLWCIISYVNPHRYSWGFAYNFPVAMLVGATTILGWCFSASKGRLPRQRETYLLLGLWLLFVISTITAIYPESAVGMLEKVSKILLMTFLTLYVVDTRRKFEIFVLVLALSVAVIGVKGGIWGLLTGAQFRLWGPEDSTLGDNNDVALALNMVSPLLLAFTKVYKNKWIRTLFFVVFGLSLFSIILTFSRGGFLGLVAITVGMAWRSPKRFVLIPALIILAPTIYSFLPSHYRDRMQTIETYEQDQSAMSRIITWGVCYGVAKDRPLTGGGFRCLSSEIFQIYAPEFNNNFDSHSSYFGILAEHGFLALVLFLALLFSTQWKLTRLQRMARRMPGMGWAQNYASALQIGLFGYMVGGTFLGRSYFDLFYHFVAAAIILQEIFHQELLATIGALENTPDELSLVEQQ